MPTTIEQACRKIARFAGCCLLVLGVWFVGLAVATRIFEPTVSVVVLAPGSSAVASLAVADVALLEVGRVAVTVAGRSPGFVRDLYAGGAWIVLPASRGGCRAPSGRRVASSG